MISAQAEAQEYALNMHNCLLHVLDAIVIVGCDEAIDKTTIDEAVCSLDLFWTAANQAGWVG